MARVAVAATAVEDTLLYKGYPSPALRGYGFSGTTCKTPEEDRNHSVLHKLDYFDLHKFACRRVLDHRSFACITWCTTWCSPTRHSTSKKSWRELSRADGGATGSSICRTALVSVPFGSKAPYVYASYPRCPLGEVGMIGNYASKILPALQFKPPFPTRKNNHTLYMCTRTLSHPHICAHTLTHKHAPTH
jgi:hypothetical protein